MNNKLLDKTWRMNNLYYIKDKNGQKVKFKMNEVQRHFHSNRAKRNIILKSRQLGLTTYECIRKLDDVLFTPNVDSLLISCDSDSSLDIFDNKIDFAWNNLNPDIRKLFLVNQDNRNTLKFDFGDGSESSIYVRSSGRSGTYRDVHISEFAKICLKYPHKAQEIITGTFPAVPIDGNIDIESTAQGQDGYFHDMFWESWGRPVIHSTQFKAHFYNWQWDFDEMAKIDEPIKDLPKPFIDYQNRYFLSDIEISYYYVLWLSLNQDWALLRQEYPTTPEEAFEASVEGSYYHNHLAQAKKEERVCNLPVEKNLSVDTYWDIGMNDEMVVLMIQEYGKEIRAIDCYHNNGESLDHYFAIMVERGYKFGKHVLPWDAAIKSVRDKKSIQDEFFMKSETYPSLNLRNTHIVPQHKVILGINKVRSIFNRLYFDKTRCDELVKYLFKYRKDWNAKRGVWRDSPIHDMSSHFADALRYLAITYTTEKKINEKPQYSTKTSVDLLTGY